MGGKGSEAMGPGRTDAAHLGSSEQREEAVGCQGHEKCSHLQGSILLQRLGHAGEVGGSADGHVPSPWTQPVVFDQLLHFIHPQAGIPVSLPLFHMPSHIPFPPVSPGQSQERSIYKDPALRSFTWTSTSMWPINLDPETGSG